MIRVVVDTNVLVSSCFGGKPRTILDLWSRGRLTLCLSESIVQEYRGVLSRLRLDTRPDSAALLRLMASGHHCLYAASTPSLRVVKADPDDDKFIECAVALDAQAVVTGDKVVAALNSYFGIRILSPSQFLEWLQINSPG